LKVSTDKSYRNFGDFSFLYLLSFGSRYNDCVLPCVVVTQAEMIITSHLPGNEDWFQDGLLSQPKIIRILLQDIFVEVSEKHLFLVMESQLIMFLGQCPSLQL
jgi:hypothetical protein